MTRMIKIVPGIALCLVISVPAWLIGNAFPIIGSPVFGILMGMIMVMIFPSLQSKTLKFNNMKSGSLGFKLEDGVKYTSKKILQYSIILL